MSSKQLLRKTMVALPLIFCISFGQLIPILASGNLEAQPQRSIKGRVVDDLNKPLPGVTVLIKGTNFGAFTDSDGMYTIELGTTIQEPVLVFTFIGMTPKEEKVDSRSVINVKMESALVALDELVVIGYGTVRKSDLTGSVSSLKKDDYNTAAPVNLGQMFQGRIAGVQVSTVSSDPGGDVLIRIRGTNSITAGNDPLYVIDGLPGAPLNSINPNDIESIEVLKDASSTAIYGSRGANGVILITTKQGIGKGLEVTYDVFGGLQTIARKLDLMNGREYMTYLNEQSIAGGGAALFPQTEIDAVGAGTDWQDEIYSTAPMQNHNLSFSGGSENSRYYISLNHLLQDGIINNTDFQRTGARINFDHNYNKFDFGFHLNTSHVIDKSVPYGGINLGAGVVAAAIQMPPNEPVYDAIGNYNESITVDLTNPVGQANSIFITGVTDRTIGDIFAQYEILDNLKAKINLGNDRRSTRSDNYLTRLNRRGAQLNGSANVNEVNVSSNLLEATLNYEKDFAASSLNAVAGYTFQQFNSNSLGASADQYPTDAFLSDNLGAGDQSTFTISSNRNRSRLISWLARVNYIIDDKYLMTASFRADGSSRFGSNHKYGYFPSVAFAWRMSQEQFLQNANFLSDLKFRVSYGWTGNQEIGNYNSLVLLGTVGYAVFDGERNVGITAIQIGSPDLKWETTRQFDVGFDYGFFKNRITGTIDYFIKNTVDLLLNLPIPSTSGFSTSLQNVGNTRNSGIEFLVESRNTVGAFGWTTSLNLSAIKNKVTSLGELPQILQGSLRFVNDLTILKVGEPMNSYYGYQVDGIFQTTDDVANSAQPTAKPGDLRYRDVNDDGQITIADRTILGDPFPDLVFGISNNFSFKNFSAEIFIEGTTGNEMLNFVKLETENPTEFRRNRLAYALDRWTPTNPSTEHPSFLTNVSARAVNSRVVEDASYARLKYIRVNYDIPGINISGISSLSVYASAQNLLTLTQYSGYNPDVTFNESNVRVDFNNHPLARIFSLGVKIVLK